LTEKNFLGVEKKKNALKFWTRAPSNRVKSKTLSKRKKFGVKKKKVFLLKKKTLPFKWYKIDFGNVHG